MKRITAKLFAASLVTGTMLASCTANFENINGNPYQPTDDQMAVDDYSLGAAMNSLGGGVIPSGVNLAQFTECLLGGTLGGYFANTPEGWTATIDMYNPTDNWTWPFMQDVVPIIYANLNLVRNVSEQTGNPVPLAIANIIKVAGMHRVADTYGPIPYSQIGTSITTVYDPLDKVYDLFFAELDASIATLTANSTAALSPSADCVFGGNVAKWIRYANSLKLRLAMRIAYADPARSKAMAEAAVADEFGVMESNEDNATYNAFAPEGNPMAFISSGWGDTAAAADIICYMSGYRDARIEKYFTASKWPGRTYVGLRHGIAPIPNKTAVGSNYSSPSLKATDPVQWMNAAEVAFLRAEAVAVFGYEMGGTAAGFYEAGVRLSFAQWGAEGADAYLADAASVPTAYIDPYTAGAQDYTRPLSSITVKWDEAATREQKQERIMIQKWIANWTLGNEAWADFRRTGYPHLIPATEAGNKSGGIVDSNLGARRMPYPQSEYLSNTANIQAAVAQYLKGPDNMATRIWWDCKN